METREITITPVRDALAKPVKFVPMDELSSRIADLHEQLSRRAFEIFERNGCVPGCDLENWFAAERELLRPIPIELKETEEKFFVKAEVPGFSEKELKVALDPRRLTITGRHEYSEQKRDGDWLREKKISDEMLRVVDFAAEVDTEKTAATLDKGILAIELPKVLAAKPEKAEAKKAAA